MYSHKRSFTGQSSRSIAALFDLPFLIFGAIVSALFAVTHTATTYFKLADHVRSLPTPLQQIAPAVMSDTLRKSAQIFDPHLILTTWIGLAIPLLIFAVAVRWTLASLRVSVQRTVTLCCLLAFYFCSFMSVALAHPEWTPGNRFVQLFHLAGPGFFQALRAILCLSLGAACLFTLTRNATSKFNRNLRWTVAGLVIISIIIFDYFQSQNQRKVHESFLKAPVTLRFIFVLPGLKPAHLQKSLRTEQLSDIRNQLSSFQEIHPSTPSSLGQFVTTLLGLEPNIHGVRHDFIDPENLKLTWRALQTKVFPKGDSVFAMAVGGPSPLTALVENDSPGTMCGQSPAQLSRLGHFQASVIPYALTPRMLEPLLNPDLVCTNRFLTLQQHLLQSYEKVTNQLHSPGLKTFVIWLSPQLKLFPIREIEKPGGYDSWDGPTKSLYDVMMTHKSFLNNTGLLQYHQTFLVGLSDAPDTTTSFVRFDGQTKSQFTDLTLDSPGQRSQTSVADLLRAQQFTDIKDSQFFYSEFTDSMTQKNVGLLPPEIKQTVNHNKVNREFILSPDLLRKTIVHSKRHVICQNVASPTGRRLLVKVSLNLRATENRLPQLNYEDFEKENLPSPENRMNLQDCLKSARDLLTESVYKDVSLRDSSSFRTLLTGLPVKSIKTNSNTLESTTDSENEALDRSTSAVPNDPEEEKEP